ncbi:hypothetical protein M2189_004286 [Bradyrhizobium japonicum]|uniref:hypothetical protein n=1 Tax=Bradyrhizobium japonicum TaxID=375 RepID=UPI00216AB149|nr:hypothetical protein [Bradyrhizobium japonicum]MCS3496755.1 hypothetical protein [Bradyrhizobium japonicum]MCS3961083.1 hypothetical protein [Bradyrhizobium japonicum]MCS4002837.1 hypothetical protein [Bradyrhizobium japonicum]
MSARVLKQRGNRATFTLKMPINAASRAAVDAENERVRRCVIPIIRDKDGRPYLEGSAVALTYRSRKCLATAFHVLSHNKDRPLFFFGADGCARILGGNFEISELHDLAAIILDAEDIEALSHIPFLEEKHIGSAAGPDGRFYASVVGYPHSASKRIDKLTLDTPMEVYSNKAREEADGFVSVIFDKKDGARSESGHVLVRDPFGKSGGAIFGMPLMGLNAVQLSATTKLVGVPTDWKQSEGRILGASVTALIPLLEKITQSDGEDQGEPAN